MERLKRISNELAMFKNWLLFELNDFTFPKSGWRKWKMKNVKYVFQLGQCAHNNKNWLSNTSLCLFKWVPFVHAKLWWIQWESDREK